MPIPPNDTLDTWGEHAEITAEQEIRDVFYEKPHVILLGAGASKAALPDGDWKGRPVPVLRELAAALGLDDLFPEPMRVLAREDFEAAFSQLTLVDQAAAREVEVELRRYFETLAMPEAPNLYDVLNLCLREKDAIFTFNWDPFLMQSRWRLAAHGGGPRFPELYFLHGNVAIGYCEDCRNSGLIGRWCSHCNEYFAPSPLLFPVEHKNYFDGSLIQGQWAGIRESLGKGFWFTIFGYSAPDTDIEAKALLHEFWGGAEARPFEQIEIIDHPDTDPSELHGRWKPFIHTHHYDVWGSFYDSWMAKHPRRTGEAYQRQTLDAKFIDANPVPKAEEFADINELIEWFRPLREAEGSVDTKPGIRPS